MADKTIQLTKLLADAGVAQTPCDSRGALGADGLGDIAVENICIDSRRCEAGSCFVALCGWTEDGHDYISAAVANGASVIICEKADAVPAGVAFVQVADTHAVLGPLAQAFYGWPARKLTTVGITGTNGKTTVAHLVYSLLQAAGLSTAMLGTIEYQTGKNAQSIPAPNTTPDALRLAELTAEMVAAGRTHLVMEVSSHALDQQRTAGLKFRVGVFTNLSGDHLDYHETMENYFSAKCKLFNEDNLTSDAVAVINRDDSWAEKIASATKADVCWYGLNPLADLQARIEQIDAAGSTFSLLADNKSARVQTSLIGRHNVYNCLAAAGAARALGLSVEEIANALTHTWRVPGRLERVGGTQDFEVFVDYAHTDDALANVLSALRPITPGRIIVVFGCGGDRDCSKRPRMAKVAVDLADRVVVTSDNPRSEEPDAVIADIIKNIDEASRRNLDIEPDRYRAIHLAIGQARGGDAVLIAGKGHETYQLVKGHKLHFNDVEVAEQCLADISDIFDIAETNSIGQDSPTGKDF